MEQPLPTLVGVLQGASLLKMATEISQKFTDILLKFSQIFRSHSVKFTEIWP